MRIDILCKPEGGKHCDLVLENVREALDRAGVEAEVHLHRDMKKMIDYRVYVSPALLIDDNVRVAGRIPAVKEIEDFISERPRFRRRLKKVA